MVPLRATAARFLLDESTSPRDECPALDDVLDLFEDMGFYLKGDQLSSKVVHHNFEYWIRIYCQKAERYIGDKRISEPLQWEHIEYLIKAVSQVELKKRPGLTIAQLRLEEDELNRRLRLEIPENTD
jgi:hypothetical protein